MSENIEYVFQKSSDGFEKIKFKDITETSIKNSIFKMCKEKRTPDGRDLEFCVFHSYCSPKDPGDEKTYKFCCEGIKSYAFCTNDYKVFDLCYLDELKFRSREKRQFQDILEKANRYEHNMSVTYRVHEEFMVNIDKRKQLLSKKLELEKIYGSEDNLETCPEYVVLLQVLQKAEDNMENMKANLEKIYALKEYQISKEEFTSNLMKTEIDKVERAKANLNNWYNRNKKSNVSQGKEMINKLSIQIDNVNQILKTSFENPVVYIHKAILALQDLEYYYRKDSKEESFYKKIIEDLQLCKKHFAIYKEFLNEKDINSIVLTVEKEQRDAVNEEKKIKQASYIRTVKTSNKGVIVKLDGTVIQDTSNQPKLIIGNMVEGKIEDEQWRSIRR
jgi:hypothetical protein